MQHPRLEELWLDLAEGTLPEEEERDLRAHLDACSECATRYRPLLRTHELSRAAGGYAREFPSPPVPRAISERVLAAARESARPAPRRAWTWWFGGGFALAAAAAALVLVIRTSGAGAEAGQLGEALAMLSGPAGVVRGGDPVEQSAAAARARWEAGELKLRAKTLTCPRGEETVSALVDGQGHVAVLARTVGARTDIRFYDANGEEVGASRVADGSRVEVVLPPLPQAGARVSIESPECGDRALR